MTALQLGDLADTEEFDHIIIEKPGHLQAIPITTAFLHSASGQHAIILLSLDNIVAVVDCARMFTRSSITAVLSPDIRRGRH